MVGCVLSQLNPRSSAFLAKNVELLGLYPIPKIPYIVRCIQVNPLNPHDASKHYLKHI